MRSLGLAIFSLGAIALNAAQAFAAEAPDADSGWTSDGLQFFDWVIVVLYVVATLGLGWFFSRRQKSTEEYFVGSRNMNPLLIGVSMFATLLSAISYLSLPGEALGKGPVFTTNLLAYPLVYLVVGYVLLPVYMKHRVTSAYELLEWKLGLSIRLLGAGMFIVLRLVWMSLLVYLTARAMAIMLGGDESWVPYIACVTGTVAVIYTSLGGLRAVVTTDALQTVLLYGGSLMVLGIITIDLGGFGWFPTQWQTNWDTQPLFSFDPATRVTVVGSVLSVFVWHTCNAGGDQTSVQRFMATTDVRAARRACATNMCVGVVVILTLLLVGFALLGYFQAHPERLRGGMSLTNNADDVFPLFIAFELPAGISGLVVSAMFAAAMSSIDSGVNSITAVVMTDGIERFRGDRAPVLSHVTTARLLAFGIGAFVVACSSLMQHIPGNFMAMTNRTANLLTTPIFGLFFFALFVPFAKPAGVWLGAICGTVAAAVIAFSGMIFGTDPETGLDPISFQWIGPVAICVNVAVGTVASWILSGNRNATAENFSQADASSVACDEINNGRQKST